MAKLSWNVVQTIILWLSVFFSTCSKHYHRVVDLKLRNFGLLVMTTRNIGQYWKTCYMCSTPESTVPALITRYTHSKLLRARLHTLSDHQAVSGLKNVQWAWHCRPCKSTNKHRNFNVCVQSRAVKWEQRSKNGLYNIQKCVSVLVEISHPKIKSPNYDSISSLHKWPLFLHGWWR